MKASKRIQRSGTLRIGLGAACAAVLLAACSSPDDPRLGEEGRVRFTGGGCTGSTTLAVGAQVSLRLESATEEALPGELDVSSEDESVIRARMGLDPSTIVLSAAKQGESRIEILSEGEMLDALVFSADPAGLVKHASEGRVLAGGAVDVAVTEVYGDCGESEDCRLIGNGFLAWRAEPSSLGAFVGDFDGTATFRTKAAGTVTLLGMERSRSRDLVTRAVEVLPADQATGLAATLTTIPFDPDVKPVDVTLPGSVAKPDAFSVRVDAIVSGGGTVPVSRRDVTFRIEGEELAVLAPTADGAGPLGTPFLPARTGTMTLVAEVPFLGLEQSFTIELQ